jgi:hypothetical protein
MNLFERAVNDEKKTVPLIFTCCAARRMIPAYAFRDGQFGCIIIIANLAPHWVGHTRLLKTALEIDRVLTGGHLFIADFALPFFMQDSLLSSSRSGGLYV